MTAEEYWQAVCDKNPVLAEREVVKLKVTGIKAMVKQAHEKGVEHCRENMQMQNLFDTLFGKK